MRWGLAAAPNFLQSQWVGEAFYLRCASSLLWRLLLSQSTGSRTYGLSAVARGPSCPLACEIPLDQRSSPHSALALAGTLLTTGPTGKLQGGVFVLFCFSKALFAKWLLRFVDVSEVDTEMKKILRVGIFICSHDLNMLNFVKFQNFMW